MSSIDQALPLRSGRGVRTGFWLVVLGAALWGVDPIFRILLSKYLTSSQIVLLEHLILFLFAAPVLWAHRSEMKGLKARHIGALLFISWGGSALATILFTQALATAVNFNSVLLLQKLQPLFAILLARLLLRETLPKRFGPLLLLALIGTYLLTFGLHVPFNHVSEFVEVGSLLSLGAAALWGGSTVMGRLMVGKMQYETVTSLRFILALPLLFIITLNQGDAWNIPADKGAVAGIVINIVLQAVLPGLLSLLLYYKGLQNTKASIATLAELSFPMVSVIINWIVYNQRITLVQLTGFLLIWLVLFAISRQQSAKEQQA
ncbi:multidrug transporter [Paenibacillus yonginensis]|uniref:Multidrug transporter n=1 Tax=Paenibacillus yonginensis TaxID=1462996 RepID=A0A1B1MXJ9_9BACL|nr:DMT family transporter [Paenibacillus yonginensis]ANS73913.1 multidrug transporter [Paenibacillus yonginensis]